MVALLVALLVWSCATSPPPPPKVTLVNEFELGADYQGAVQRVAFDASGDAWMVTTRTLYRAVGGTLEAIDTVAVRSDKLTIAPAGSRYIKLTQGEAPASLFTGELVETPKKPIAKLRLNEFPHGFVSIFLGGDGRLIVTISPLQDPEGLRGDFLYVFWSRDGNELARVVLDKRLAPVVDVTGEAMLLMGESDAIAFRNDGQRLWKVDGRFRAGALAGKGTIALLNPADQHGISEVRVYNNGRLTSVGAPAPVSALALTADGAVGALGLTTGDVYLVSPPSCNTTTCKPLKELAGLDESLTYAVTSLRFIDSKVLAIGRIQGEGSEPDVVYRGAEVVATTIDSNQPLFRRVIPLEQPATWSPTLDATFGLRAFAAYTPRKALLVTLEE
jgi:hypothetical protein